MRLFATIMLTLFIGACTGTTTTTTTNNTTETTESSTTQTTVVQDPSIEAKAPKLIEITKEEGPVVTTPSVVVTPEESIDGESSPQTQQVPEKE